MKVTMRAVAESLGLDTSTVSLALRNDPRLRAATQRRAQARAAEMGYRPDPMVSALMRERRTGRRAKTGETIAFLHTQSKLDAESPPHIGPALEALRRHGRKNGYSVETFRLDAKGMSRKRLRDVLLARGVRKVVLASPPQKEARIEFDWEPFSVASFDYVLQSPRVDRVVFNHFQGMTTLLEALREAGRRRISLAFERGMDERVERQWSGAFYAWAARLPKADRLPPFLRDRFDKAPLEAWVARHQPDALLSVGRHAAALIERLRKAGWNVPKKILVANLNRVSITETGLDRDFDQMGQALLQLLQSQTNAGHSGEPSRRVTIQAECQMRWPEANAPD